MPEEEEKQQIPIAQQESKASLGIHDGQGSLNQNRHSYVHNPLRDSSVRMQDFANVYE